MEFFGGLLVLYLIYFFGVYIFVYAVKFVFTVFLWILETILRELATIIAGHRHNKRNRARNQNRQQQYRQYSEQTERENTQNRQYEEEEHSYQQEQEQEQEQEQQQEIDPYADALKLLGLPEEFSHRKFKKAYRRAMMKVHPDRGGTTKQAQAVNQARDVINRYKGW